MFSVLIYKVIKVCAVIIFLYVSPTEKYNLDSFNLLQIFHDATMDRILKKQFLLTGYLEYLLLKNFSSNDSAKIEILTPMDHRWRGCQLSLVFNIDVGKVHRLLEENGVVVSYSIPW